MMRSLASSTMLSRTQLLLSPASCSSVVLSASKQPRKQHPASDLRLGSPMMLHTSGPPQRARFKHRYTHKPFWRPAMTYRADDDPITWENRQFIEQVKRESYVNTRLTDDEGVANGNGGERYTQCSNVPSLTALHLTHI